MQVWSIHVADNKKEDERKVKKTERRKTFCQDKDRKSKRTTEKLDFGIRQNT